MTTRRLTLLTLIAALLGACASVRYTASDAPHPTQVEELATAIAGLGAAVDPQEARAAAEVAFAYPLELAEAYELTSPPLMHNTLVNFGFKPRGLCVHWTRDMLVRLGRMRGHPDHNAV